MKPHEHITSDIVMVSVGHEQRKYSLHGKLLLSKSEFFARCLGSGFQEGLSREVQLPEDDPDAFEIVVDWLYTEETSASDIQDTRQLCAHVRAFFLADKLAMVDDCQRSISQAIHEHLVEPLGRHVPVPGPLLDLIAEINPPQTCELRQLIVSCFARDVQHLQTYVDKEGEAMKPEYMSFWRNGGDLVIDVMVEQALHREACGPVLMDPCETHEDGPLCRCRQHRCVAWDFGLTPKEKRRKEKEMRIAGTWDTRVVAGYD